MAAATPAAACGHTADDVIACCVEGCDASACRPCAETGTEEILLGEEEFEGQPVYWGGVEFFTLCATPGCLSGLCNNHHFNKGYFCSSDYCSVWACEKCKDRTFLLCRGSGCGELMCRAPSDDCDSPQQWLTCKECNFSTCSACLEGIFSCDCLLCADVCTSCRPTYFCSICEDFVGCADSFPSCMPVECLSCGFSVCADCLVKDAATDCKKCEGKCQICLPASRECGACGNAFCSLHGALTLPRFPIVGFCKQLDSSGACEGCGLFFCSAHLPSACSTCKKELCGECAANRLEHACAQTKHARKA